MKDLPLEITGYPAEFGSEQHTASGKLVSVDKGTVGNYLLQYKVDTSPGCSGTNVMLTDERWQRDQLQKDLEEQKLERLKRAREDEQDHLHIPCIKRCIAVHTGANDVDECNFGTLITPEIQQWIRHTLDAYNNTCKDRGEKGGKPSWFGHKLERGYQED